VVGTFKYELVVHLTSESVSEKTENRLIFGEVMGKSLVSCYLVSFVTHNVEDTRVSISLAI